MGDIYKLALLGDIHLGLKPWAVDPKVSVILEDTDLVAANIESPFVGGSAEPENKRIVLRSDPAIMSVLHELGINAAGLANNHFLDWGVDAAQQTVQYLVADNIAVAGVGISEDAALTPVIIGDDFRVALFSVGERQIGTVLADGSVPYGCAGTDVEALSQAVASVRESVDLVVLSLHWGLTNYHYPSPEQIQQARMLIDIGVDIISGHHPHVVQGYESYKKGLIFYSLGNFLFGGYHDRDGKAGQLSKENRAGTIALVTIGSDGGKSVDFVFTEAEADNEIRMRDEKGQNQRREFIGKLSKPLNSEKAYLKFYKKYLAERILRRGLFWLNPVKWRHINAGHIDSLRLAITKMFARNGAS